MNKSELREEALRLRIDDRLSLKVIARELGISKSTASLWLRDHKLDPSEIRAKSDAYNQTPEARAQIIEAGVKGRASLTANRKPIEKIGSGGWAYIRKRIFEERGRKCERCGWREVNPYNGIVPVQIDHINGDSKDHRPENLIVLCPNCHAMTEHFMFYGGSHKGTWGKKGTKRYR